MKPAPGKPGAGFLYLPIRPFPEQAALTRTHFVPPAVLAGLLAATPGAWAQDVTSVEPATAPEAPAASSAPLVADPTLPRLRGPRQRLLTALLAQPSLPQATSTGSSTQREEISAAGITVTGDDIERNAETGLITITGNPRATRGGDSLRATRMIYNPATRQVTAEGTVVLAQGDQEFEADRVVYNFETRTGQAERARTRINDYFLNAERILLEPGPRYVAERTRFTSCDEPHPHYSTYARRIEIRPRERMLARGLGVDLLGTRLVTAPGFDRSLKPDTSKGGKSSLQLPSFGYDNRNGFYVAQEFDVREKGPVWVDAYARVNSAKEPFGGLQAATAGELQFVGSLFYRDIAENQRSRNLQVSRLPELGIVWTPGRDAPRPGHFLPHQVMGMRRPAYLQYSRDWQVSAQLTAGFFRQHRGDDATRDDATSRSGGRIQVQGQALLPYVKLGRRITLNDLRLLARQSVYDNGSTHLLAGVGIGKLYKFGNWRAGVDRFNQYTSGSTPFSFDDVELREEWRPRLEFQSRNFNFSYFARIRSFNSGIFDQVFEISRTFHCLEPRIVFGTRQGFVGLDLRIAGLGGGTRSKPGAPRSTREGSGREKGGELIAPSTPAAP